MFHFIPAQRQVALQSSHMGTQLELSHVKGAIADMQKPCYVLYQGEDHLSSVFLHPASLSPRQSMAALGFQQTHVHWAAGKQDIWDNVVNTFCTF